MSLFTSLKTAGNATVQIGGTVQQRTRNIANANDPDYHRTEIRFTYTGNFLRLGNAERVTDTGISRELLLQQGVASESETLNEYTQSLNSILGLGSSTPYLTDVVQQFEQSWRDFQSNPELDATQREIVNKGVNLAETINDIAIDLSKLRNQAENAIEADVAGSKPIIA